MSTRIALLLSFTLIGSAGVQAEQAPATGPYEFALAKVLAADGATQEAEAAFQKALEQAPDDPIVHVEFGRFLLQVGRKEDAIRQVDAAQALAPRDKDVLEAVAQVHLEAVGAPSRSLTRALAALETLRTLPSPDPQAMVSLAQIYLQQGRNAAAADTLEDLDARLPGNPYIGSLLVEALVRSGRIDRAIERLQQALERDPEDLRSRLTLAELQRRRDNPDAAVETLKNAPADELSDVQLRRHLALALYLSGHVEEARSQLESVRSTEPQSPGDDFLYGSILSALGENEAALAILQPLAETDPVQLERVEALADVLTRMGRPEKAAEAFDKAAKALQQQDDTQAANQARLDQIRALLGAHSWAKAVRVAGQALQDATASDKPPLLESLIDGLHGAGRDDEALRRLDDSKDVLPAPLILIKRLRILHDRGDLEVVNQRLRELGASEDPGDIAVAGRLYLEWEQYDQAIDLLRRATQLRPENASTRYWLASAYQEAGREADAESLLRQLVHDEPDFAPALNFLGYLLADGDRDLNEAVQLTQRAVRVDPTNGAYVDSLGWAHFRLGELDLAKRYLERAARLIPDDATIYEHLGDLYAARGERDAARKVYRRALDLHSGHAEDLERKLASLEPGS